MAEEFNIDKALKDLDEINNKLAEEGIELKDSIDLYKKGVELAAKCDEHLKGVEKELEIINQN